MNDELRIEHNRIGRLEDKVDTLSDDLRQHIIDESGVFTDFKMGIERLVVTAEQHSKTMDRMADTMEGLALQNVRITVVEDFRARAEPLLRELHDKQDAQEIVSLANAEKTNRIYWISGIAWTVGTALLGGLWALVTYFKG